MPAAVLTTKAAGPSKSPPGSFRGDTPHPRARRPDDRLATGWPRRSPGRRDGSGGVPTHGQPVTRSMNQTTSGRPARGTPRPWSAPSRPCPQGHRQRPAAPLAVAVAGVDGDRGQGADRRIVLLDVAGGEGQRPGAVGVAGPPVVRVLLRDEVGLRAGGGPAAVAGGELRERRLAGRVEADLAGGGLDGGVRRRVLGREAAVDLAGGGVADLVDRRQRLRPSRTPRTCGPRSPATPGPRGART